MSAVHTEYFITLDTHCRTSDACIKTARGKLVKRAHLATGIPQLRELMRVPEPEAPMQRQQPPHSHATSIATICAEPEPLDARGSPILRPEKTSKQKRPRNRRFPVDLLLPIGVHLRITSDD